MRIQVNRLHHPVTALGPGTRAGIWLQGCSIGCRGCLSRDTWDAGAGGGVEVTEVLEWVAGLSGRVDGVTISGGEPFDQPAPLLELLVGLDLWRQGLGGAPEPDLLCYSGYSLRRVERRHPEALAPLDAVITGPYREDLPTDLVWRGSSNQELVPLSPLGRERYGSHVDERRASPPIQVAIESDAIRLIGIPRRGDIGGLEATLDRAGIELGDASWRP
jgi:anaerobic ribonucleoside-triphosphate reductase activating protein